MIAGGSGSGHHALGVGGFAAMRALSTRNDDPQKASRPWDQRAMDSLSAKAPAS